MRLSRFLPGVFWLLIGNLLLFYGLFRQMFESRWVAAAYYCWFSVINLFLISVFWTLMSDTFSSGQATRLFAFIAEAGGSTGAILGPVITTTFVKLIGVSGLLLIACGGFLLVIVLIHFLMREKEKLRTLDRDTQQTTLDHSFLEIHFADFLFFSRSRYLMGQAIFFILMTWIATILYFLQADFVAKIYSAVEGRTIAFADVDLFVNVCSAAVLIFGLGFVLHQLWSDSQLGSQPRIDAFRVCCARPCSNFLCRAVSPRSTKNLPIRDCSSQSSCTVRQFVDQQSKYKAKNVIDTSVYRFGDSTAAWLQTGLRSLGMGFFAIIGLGVAVSTAWGLTALIIGRRYETIVHSQADGFATAPRRIVNISRWGSD